MSDANSWYVTAAGREQGPFNPQQLRQLVVEGRLQPDMAVRRGDQPAGVPASAIRGLFTIEELQAWQQRQLAPAAPAAAAPPAATAPAAAERSPSRPITTRAARSDSRPAGSARIKATAAANHPSGLLVPPPPGGTIGAATPQRPASTPAPTRPAASAPVPAPAPAPAPAAAAPVRTATASAQPQEVAPEDIALPNVDAAAKTAGRSSSAPRSTRTQRSPSRASASSRRRGAKGAAAEPAEAEAADDAPARPRKKKKAISWQLYTVFGIMGVLILYLGLKMLGVFKGEQLHAQGTWRIDTSLVDRENDSRATDGNADEKRLAQVNAFFSQRVLQRARIVVDQDRISLPIGGRVVQVEYKPQITATNALDLRLIPSADLPEALQFGGALTLQIIFPKDGGTDRITVRFNPDTYIKRHAGRTGYESFDLIRESTATTAPSALDAGDIQKYLDDLARIYEPSATAAASAGPAAPR